MTNRRRFIKNSVAGGLLAALTPGSVFASITQKKTAPVTAGYQRLQRLVGSHFIVVEAGDKLTQLELTDLLRYSADSRLEQFYMYLTITSVSALQEGSYHLHHPAIGDQFLFLQPLDQNASGPHYRATIGLF